MDSILSFLVCSVRSCFVIRPLPSPMLRPGFLTSQVFDSVIGQGLINDVSHSMITAASRFTFHVRRFSHN